MSIRSSGTWYAQEGASNLVKTKALTGTTYTLTAADHLWFLEFNNAATVTVTIPTNATLALPIGYTIDLLQTGAGQVVFSTTGITLNSTVGTAPKIRTQWSSATLVKRATDTWVLIGDISV